MSVEAIQRPLGGAFGNRDQNNCFGAFLCCLGEAVVWEGEVVKKKKREGGEER